MSLAAGLFPIDKWNFSTQFVLNNLPPENLRRAVRDMTELQLKKGRSYSGKEKCRGGRGIRGKMEAYRVNRTGKEQVM